MAITREQLESLYRDLEEPLFNFALRWLFNSASAEEMVHEAFIRIWKNRESVEVNTAKSLLYKTVQNLSLNEIRRRKIRDSFKVLQFLNFQKEAPANTEENLILAQDLKAMELILEKIPLEWKEVLLLSQYSDLTYAEIAKTLEIPEGTVASRKNRALQFLRDHFHALEETKNEK